jgi:diphosphomevalonate decarboxylase
MSQPIVTESEANSNIALIKYWGKLERDGNYPAVPSLSLTLSGLCTTTRIELDDGLQSDEVLLDGERSTGRPRDRITRVLDEFRRLAKSNRCARVCSHNDFPTAAGLASSASGFAALVTAADAAYGTGLDRTALSSLARGASASAARSLFGGWSILPVGADAASELAPADYWHLVLLVAVTASGKKAIGSTEAMNLTRNTSPFYGAWVAGARKLFDGACNAVLDRDLSRLGMAMEQSTLMMHATMLAACPAVVYFAPGTLNVMQQVTSLRAEGIPAYYTMDAGPHVKVLCNANDASRVRVALGSVDGVIDVIVAQPGPGARVRTLV